MSWQVWPNTGAGKGVFIRKSENPNALNDVKGSLVRGNFLVGEPLRRDRLVKGPTAGLMSTMLSSGIRAVAINIDVIAPGARERLIHWIFRRERLTRAYARGR